MALRPQVCITSPEPLVSLALSRESARVALGQSTGGLQLLSYQAALRERQSAPALLSSFSVHSAPVRAVVFAKEESLCSGAADGEVCLWDVATDTEVWRTTGHSAALSRLSTRAVEDHLTPGQRNFLVSGDDDGVLKMWDLRTRECVKELKHHTDYISGLTFGSGDNSNVMLATSGDGTLSAVDLRKKGKVQMHAAHLVAADSGASASLVRKLTGIV
eukprot:scaffold2331_cov252-Pinguiococcus_pyrenoidosus.AAC.10